MLLLSACEVPAGHQFSECINVELSKSFFVTDKQNKFRLTHEVLHVRLFSRSGMSIRRRACQRQYGTFK